MSSKTKLATLGTVSLTLAGMALVLAFNGTEQLNAASAEASYGREKMYEEKSVLTGIPADLFRQGKEQGIKMEEVAEENGVSEEEWHEAIQEYHNNRLAEYVEEGLITQTEADRRYEEYLSHQGECDEQGKGKLLYEGLRGEGMGRNNEHTYSGAGSNNGQGMENGGEQRR